MKNRSPKDAEGGEKSGGSKAVYDKKKKHTRRFGGRGRVAKSDNSYFNPAVIKKKREFYKNAKYVNKFKKSVKQLQTEVPSAIKYLEEESQAEDGSKTIENNMNEDGSKTSENNKNEDGSKTSENNKNEDGCKVSENNKRRKNKGSRNLMELYQKKHEEKEKARMEREAIIKAKKEEREKAEARRKALKGNMMKKTHKGQPLMKYRIEHLLETIQSSMNKS